MNSFILLRNLSKSAKLACIEKDYSNEILQNFRENRMEFIKNERSSTADEWFPSGRVKLETYAQNLSPLDEKWKFWKISRKLTFSQFYKIFIGVLPDLRKYLPLEDSTSFLQRSTLLNKFIMSTIVSCKLLFNILYRCLCPLWPWIFLRYFTIYVHIRTYLL